MEMVPLCGHYGWGRTLHTFYNAMPNNVWHACDGVLASTASQLDLACLCGVSSAGPTLDTSQRRRFAGGWLFTDPFTLFSVPSFAFDFICSTSAFCTATTVNQVTDIRSKLEFYHHNITIPFKINNHSEHINSKPMNKPTVTRTCWNLTAKMQSY